MTLEEKLEAVPRSYDWFVSGALHLANDFGVESELENYIDEHPDANSGEVLLFLVDYCGLEPLPIVPDDKA